MRINLTSVLVDDQDKALRFYSDVLGFAKKAEIPLGRHRWLTVVSPDDPDGTELVLEPHEHPAGLGVQFTQEPAQLGRVTIAVSDDTCRNLIQIAQLMDPPELRHPSPD